MRGWLLCRQGLRTWALLGMGGRRNGDLVPGRGSWRCACGGGVAAGHRPLAPQDPGFLKTAQEGQSRLGIQQRQLPVLRTPLPVTAPLRVSTSEWGSCSASCRSWAGCRCTEGGGDGAAFTRFCSWTYITSRHCDPGRNALG